MKSKTAAKALRLEYRCDSCGFRGFIVLEPEWNLDQRQAAALQHHDISRPDSCAEWRPRFWPIAQVKE